MKMLLVCLLVICQRAIIAHLFLVSVLVMVLTANLVYYVATAVRVRTLTLADLWCWSITVCRLLVYLYYLSCLCYYCECCWRVE